MPPSLDIPWSWLGRRPYRETWQLQERLRQEVTDGSSPGQLLLVEHPPTISIGRGEEGSNLLLAAEVLRQEGFDVVETNRGGKVTYHGPGQLVAYPVVDLRRFGPGVKRFVRGLEETMIRLLARHGIAADRKEAWPGAWVGGRKIGSIGIHVRRQISIHGLALNVCPDLRHFSVITPCGIAGVEMTSMQREGCPKTLEEILGPFVEAFGEVFGCSLRNG